MPLKELVKEIIDKTSYSGNKSSGKKIISASSITNDILPEVLKYRYGLTRGDKIEQNTLGSIFQLGIDSIFSGDTDKKIALRLKYPLKNGWTLSGEIDLLWEKKDELYIIDFKLSKCNRISIVEKDGVLGDYQSQLRVYEFLIQNAFEDYVGQPIRKFLLFAIKDQSYFTKNAPENSIEIWEANPDDRLSDEQLLEIINERIDEMEKYIQEPSKKPPQCSNLFWSRKYGDKAVPIRCTKYCNVSQYCSYAKNPLKKEKKNLLMGLINGGDTSIEKNTPPKPRNPALDL